MDYEHHIFLSYAHGKIWSPWIKETFVPKLEAYLELEVGPVEISVDYQIQPGALWDPNLHRRVARSKLMLPLLTAKYFHSEWCRRELALMFEREQSLGLEARDDNYGFLIPVRLGDGLTFPDLIGRVQYLDFEQFADPDLPTGSLRAAEFNRKVKELAVVIARTLPKLPDACCDEWENFTGNGFIEQLRPKPLPTPQPSRLLV
jgi:TIR domain